MIDGLERGYLDALGQVAAWQRDGEVLVLLDATATELLRFEPATLLGGWELRGLLRGTAITSPLPDTALSLELRADGTCGGSAGCNRYRASYTADGEAIAVAAASATRMACSAPDGVMEQEHEFLQLLGRSARFELDGDTLALQDHGGARLLSLVRAPVV